MVVALHPRFTRGETPTGRGLGARSKSAAFDHINIFGLFLDDVAVEVQVAPSHPISVEETPSLRVEVGLEAGRDDLLVVLSEDDVAFRNDAKLLRPEVDDVRGDVGIAKPDGDVAFGSNVPVFELLLFFREKRQFARRLRERRRCRGEEHP